MSLARSLLAATFLMLAATVFPQGCGNAGLVGGDCASGLTNCSNHCVDLGTDERNCGSCATVCQNGLQCVNGRCGGPGSGGEPGWGGAGGDWGGNHGRDGSTGADASTDAKGDGIVEFDVQYPDVHVCSPPYDTASDCGSCGKQCSGATPVCAPISGSFQCKPLCEAPLVNCGGACVDLDNDSDHCGSCPNACPSGICQGGKCLGAQAGHQISLCMNYREYVRGSQPTLLLGNAVFLAPGKVKVLAYDEYADPTVASRVDAALTWAAYDRGRTYTLTRSKTAADVHAKLKKPDYDVLLVYDQSRASTGALTIVGDSWATAIESFTGVGGVVVVLAAADGTNEMTDLLRSARILDASALSPFSLVQAVVRAPGDAVGLNVVSPFMTRRDSCSFTTSVVPDKDTVFVVTEPGVAGASKPIAVHHIVLP